MPSPFPGMDPYLEYSTFWSSFHTRLIVAIAEVIEPQLSSNYYVEVESRTYQSDEMDGDLLIGVPDAIVFSRQLERTPPAVLSSGETSIVTQSSPTQSSPETVEVPMPIEVKERYLEVREMGSDQVITAMELLSPTNKRQGEGRMAYEKKRRFVLGSQTNLVELDLLRASIPMVILGMRSPSVYRILISRSQHRPQADLYSISLQQPLPSFPVPLKPDEPEPIIQLQEVFDRLYERSRYATRIDYRQPLPPPKLSESDQQWVDKQLLRWR
jgi:hypothetical protein